MGKYKHGGNIMEMAADLYVKDALNCTEVAQALGIAEKSVKTYLSYMGVTLDEKKPDPEGKWWERWCRRWDAERREWIWPALWAESWNAEREKWL